MLTIVAADDNEPWEARRSAVASGMSAVSLVAFNAGAAAVFVGKTFHGQVQIVVKVVFQEYRGMILW